MTRILDSDFPTFETEKISEAYSEYYSTMSKIDMHFVEFMEAFEGIGRGE